MWFLSPAQCSSHLVELNWYQDSEGSNLILNGKVKNLYILPGGHSHGSIGSTKGMGNGNILVNVLAFSWKWDLTSRTAINSLLALELLWVNIWVFHLGTWIKSASFSLTIKKTKLSKWWNRSSLSSVQFHSFLSYSLSCSCIDGWYSHVLLSLPIFTCLQLAIRVQITGAIRSQIKKIC